MARMIKNRPCVICGAGPVQRWTLDNMTSISVTYLCNQHSEPLRAIMVAAGDLVPDEQVPLPDRGKEPAEDAYAAHRKAPRLVALDWTPPEEEPAVLEAEDLAVKSAREEGKSWADVAVTLGKSKQYVENQYGKKYKFVPPGKKLPS